MWCATTRLASSTSRPTVAATHMCARRMLALAHRRRRKPRLPAAVSMASGLARQRRLLPERSRRRRPLGASELWAGQDRPDIRMCGSACFSRPPVQPQALFTATSGDSGQATRTCSHLRSWHSARHARDGHCGRRVAGRWDQADPRVIGCSSRAGFATFATRFHA